MPLGISTGALNLRFSDHGHTQGGGAVLGEMRKAFIQPICCFIPSFIHSPMSAFTRSLMYSSFHSSLCYFIYVLIYSFTLIHLSTQYSFTQLYIYWITNSHAHWHIHSFTLTHSCYPCPPSMCMHSLCEFSSIHSFISRFIYSEMCCLLIYICIWYLALHPLNTHHKCLLRAWHCGGRAGKRIRHPSWLQRVKKRRHDCKEL